MSTEIDTFTYMMAAEKMVNLLYSIESTMEFMKEYDVKPDEEVKKALIPLIKQMNDWAAK